MQLYILDINPLKSAMKLPVRYRFKMLLELAQMVSTLTGVGYRPVRQGKEIVRWISCHRRYVYYYFGYLYFWSKKHINMSQKTVCDLYLIWQSLKPLCGGYPSEAYFRYKKGYICKISSKSLIPIKECIDFYKKYLKWKEEKTG